MNVTVVGNGAHATGAPTSLLSILERRPPGVSLRMVLVGGGPLLSRYETVADELQVLDAPDVRGLRARRLVQELRLARQLFRSTQPRSADEVLVVNTVEFEAALLRARMWPHRARVMIRENMDSCTGLRGRLRVSVLRSAPSVAMVAVGERQAAEWRTRLGRDVARRVNVYEPGPASPDASPTGPIRFLVVGGRTPTKGVDLAVAAYGMMQRRDDARLVIASGDFEPHVDGGVVWLGYVPDLGREMGHHGDALIGASRQEAFARAVVEAAMAGMPTVAWDTGGYSEQVPALGGRLVRPFEPAAMAAAMDELVSQGRAGLRTMAPEIRRKALSQFDPERAAAAWWAWILS